MALGQSVNISSQNYPGFYGDNLACHWQFSNSDDTGFSITIHDILLSPGGDYLYIGHGENTIIHQAQWVLPDGTTFVVDDSRVWFTFITSKAIRQRGFLVEVKAVSVNGEY